MAEVCAFVLTRDRQDLLVECVRALLGQTVAPARLVVLDNASSEAVAGRLAREGLSGRVELHRSERNLGGAGGFAEGIRLAREGGAEWIWLMDDDAEPEPDALERLLASPPARDPRTAVLCSAVVHPDGSVDRMHRCRLGRLVVPMGEDAYRPGGYPDVDCASFVGFMVRAGAARRVGLPRAEFFLGYDDAEYSVRLRRAGGRIRLVAESRVVHKIVIGGGRQGRRAALWNRLLGQQYAPVEWEAFWRDLYRIRNFMFIKRVHDGTGPAGLVALTLVYLAKSLMYDPQPLRRLPWIARYAVKGWRGDFRAIAPEAWPARV